MKQKLHFKVVPAGIFIICLAFSIGLSVTYLEYTSLGYPRLALLAGVFSIVLMMMSLISLSLFLIVRKKVHA